MNKTKLFFILLLIFISCSKIIPPTEFVDKSPPRIISTSPADGEYNVPESVQINIEFSETIDPSSVDKSVFKITPQFNYSYIIDGNTITITPNGNLPTGQRFWFTVKKSIKDKAGNNMENDYNFSFKIKGHNYSQAPVTFIADASAGREYYPQLYVAGSWDIFGDYDSEWNMGRRYPMYDDGNHNDGEPGDGIWGYTTYLTIDLSHIYMWVVDDDNNPDNGYIKSQEFFITTSSPKRPTLYLYSPVNITFNYYDIENKVTSEIYLRGDFNNWGMLDRMSGPFGANRLFTITKSLREGTYSYKYYVDGDWDKVNKDNRSISVVYGGSTVQNDYYTGGNPVVFNYYDLENKVQNSIYLKGDFNGWSEANRMDGPYGTNRRFTTTVDLRTGVEYQYKYYVDGDWDKVNKNNRKITISAGTTEVNDYYLGPLTVTFIYYDIEGNVNTSIHIRGDFNDWILDYAYQLTADPQTNYKYSITLELDQGTYQYKYYVDGDWDKVNTDNRTVTISSTNSTIIKDYYAGP